MKKLLIIPFLCWMALSASNPTKAMLYSAFIPGGGQVYNQAYAKAGLVIGLQGYLVASTLHHDKKADDYKRKADNSTDPYLTQLFSERADEHKERRTSNIWWIGVTAALSVLDAYVDAHLADFEQEKSKLHLRFDPETIGIQYRF